MSKIHYGINFLVLSLCFNSIFAHSISTKGKIEASILLVEDPCDPSPTVDAGNDQGVCEGETVTLIGTSSPIGNGWEGAWSGPGLSNPGINTTVTTEALSAGQKTFTYTLSKSGCASVSDDVVVNVDALPPIASVTEEVLNVCVVDPINLNGNDPSPGIGVWTKEAASSATATIDDINDPTSTVSMAAGSMVAKWTIVSKNGYCPSTEATVEVHVINAADPTADLTVNYSTVCIGDFVIFTAVGSNLGTSPTFEFIEAGNPSNVLQFNSVNNTYQPPTLKEDLSVKVIVTSNSSCITPGNEKAISNPETVKVVKPATADIIGFNDGDRYVTFQTTESFSAVSPGVGYSGYWMFFQNGSIAVNTPSGLNTTVSSLTPFSHVGLCWRTQDNFGYCPASEECIEVERVELTVCTGSKQTICETEIGAFGILYDSSPNTLIGETTTWTSVGSGDFALITPSSILPALTGPGTYQYTYTIENQLFPGPPSNTCLHEIIVYESEEVNSGENQIICNSGVCAELNGIVTSGTATWTSSGDGTFTPNATTLDASYCPSVNDLSAGQVTLTLTAENNGVCPVSTDDMVLTMSVCTGVEKVENTGVSVYPNPFENSFVLKTKGAYKVSVYDITGTLVFAGTYSSPVSLGADWAAGIYLVNVTTKTGSEVIKVTKH